MKKNKLILVTILVLLFLLSISTIVQAASFPTPYEYEAQNYNSSTAQVSGGYSSTKGGWAFTIKGSSFSAPSDLQGMNSKKQKYYYGVICLQHADRFKNSGKDTVVGRVQFYETNMKVTNYKTNKSTTYKYSSSSAPGKYGATVAYLLTYTGNTVPTGLAKNGENYLSKTQWLIWYARYKGILKPFYNGLGLDTNTMTSSSWPYVSGESFGSSDAETKAEIESIYEVATTYQSFVKNYEEPKVVKSPTDATNPIVKDNSGNLTIGPCQITYTSASKNDVKLGGLVSKTLYYEDTSGTTKKLSSSNYKIVNSSGENISIPSGEDFYIKISADVVEEYHIDTITKLDVQYRKVVCTGDVFLMDSGGDSQLWMVVGTAKIAYKNTTLTLPINSDANTYISLQINKIDATSGEAIEGIGFTIKDNSSEEYIDEDGNHVEKPVTIYTDANGQINISNISLNSKNTTFTVQEVESKNLYYKADTSIKKDNVSVSGDTATVTITNEKPYSLTIQKSDPNEQKTNLTAKFVIRYDGMSTESGDGDTSYSGDNLDTEGDETTEDNITENSSTDEGLTEDETIGEYDITDEWLTIASDGTVSYSSSKSAITVENGTLTIKGIKRGVYHIYEVEAPSGYDITQQDGYDSTNNWVDCGTAYVGIDDSGNQDNNSCSITVNKDNKKYVKITGYVWNEGNVKNDVINDVYDGNNTRVKDITVQLIDKNGTVLATTKTDENGEYIFETLDNGESILYSKLASYRVQFLYNKGQYVSVALNENVNVANASRAIEDDEPQVQDEEDGTIGYARTSANGTLANYYNEETYTVETINFGMMEKPTEDYTIKETMEYVKITKGDYAFKYTIGDSESGDEYTDAEKELLSTVNSQISTKPTFTQSLYPSDIAYNKSNNFSDDSSDKYRVYVVYKISVTNNASTSYYQYGNESLDLHDEDILYLSSLTNTYNQLIDNYTDGIDKYELDGTINDDVDTDEVKAEIGNWEEGQSTSDYDTANYTGEKYEKEGIAATKTVSTYIQFRITDEALYKLVNLSNEDRNWFINCASEATANGYHGYKRDDWYWAANDTENTNYYANCYHTSKTTERTASALFLKLKLKDTRTVSGTVFEDKAEESTLEDSGERLGDGQYAVDENTLSDVVVSLMNAEDNTVAKLYVWENGSAVSKDAIVKVEDDGTYQLEGMVPGKYYLQYVYGNGTVKYTDINGESISIGNIDTKINGEVIDANDYKSTILTGNAKDTDGNENGWFIDNGTYNIATDTISTDASGNEEDIITARTTSDDEMYNATVENREAITITAQSPVMDINFEYVENKEIAVSVAGSLNTDLGGMCFGIIERAHTNITLEKEISNVKLTLQNGTVVINGNPTDSNVSQYLVDLDGSSTDDGSGYAKIEIDSNMLYGSSVEVTYKVTVTNESDVDYATEGYYTKGEDKTKLVETIASKIVDYASEGTTYTSLDNTEFSGDKALETMDGITESDYFTQGAIDASEEFNKLLIESTTALTPLKKAEADGDESNAKEIHEITIRKTLNTTDDDMGETAYAEIIGLKNLTFTPQYESISGNYELGDDEATEDTTNEEDDDSATLAISPSTGQNNSYTVYIFAGVMLVIVATGLIVIKKYVL